ncbi:hypothetical protein [Flavobacterium wongokense]|uniref:hypothetical protein n=1 Tax=Flavobacterium wongokense TaxID=2910674 RepID=UPI001F451A95|nr:hypothetical protein [Flavobacterium sp. WG47]MCF6132966.1 hypothetical protein [Flavobacterium sp. WG47]
MKLKTYIASLLLLVIASSHAQVGIGTTVPDASSILDITSTNSGLLIPRVALTSTSDVTTIASPVTSLLIYNSGFSPNGYYYWNGSVWVQLTTSSNGWLLSGNSGTVPNTNFLGTTDDVDIVFKRFNVRSGFIGNPSIASGNKNTSFGANSLNALGTGIRNTAIGTNVMPSNTTGQLNVAIGDQTMFSNQGGSTNTAIGVGALYSNSSGNSNVAIGRNALTSANASNNTAIGFGALRQNATGNYNVAIGNQAAYNETGSNKLYIEMSTVTSPVAGSDSSVNNALIYGEFDNRIVRTNGTIQIGNPATTGFSLPTIRGNAGQVLQTNGAGSTSWTNDNSTMSVTRTNLSANQALTNTGWQKINFNTVVFDLNSEFSAGRFTATKAGYYEVNAGFHTDNQSNLQFYSIGVYKNGALYQQTSANHTNLGPVPRNITCIVSLGVGDYIEIYAENYQAGVNIDSYFGKTFFEVKQIR